VVSDETKGVIDTAISTTHAKADHYRDTAERLRSMAEGEPIGQLRDQLLGLASQYENLAAMLLGR
jgi:hypothetical protein